MRSDEQKHSDITTLDHHMPAPPQDGSASAGVGAEITVTDDHEAVLPQAGVDLDPELDAALDSGIKLMDHHMPAPPQD
ncbi:hypothetical protein I3F58_22865 [Streptomyces sp. MUM 203J]|uniref:hypothetical protein n=1 Tax=Streptomyces sp. MUM 203J TaxID=2791990 RepID=UPI001F040F41|nr:hypothetical protein [Streptomyces sp. MUM 203J]MCH0542340.1 hypothetical protein [Streptomyces sp. MUM 203J]